MTRKISLTETAKLIRQELKATFGKATKFSVRTKSYSMGCSITVSWTDGPTAKEVDRILDRFEGSSFDGMQDLKSNRTQELNGEQVSFAPDYVNSNRTESLNTFETVKNIVVERYPQILVEGWFSESLGGSPYWTPKIEAHTSGIDWHRIYRRAVYNYDATTGQFILSDLLNGLTPDNWQYHENPTQEPIR